MTKFPKIKPEDVDIFYAYSVADCAKLLSVSESTVRNRIKDGLLKTKTYPTGERRIPGKEIRRFLKLYTC